MAKRKLSSEEKDQQESSNDLEAADEPTTSGSSYNDVHVGSGRKYIKLDNNDQRNNIINDQASNQPPVKRVRFKGVTVYYFPRSQGFTCVPSNGGTTLGMGHRHDKTESLTFAEHEKERKLKKNVYNLLEQEQLPEDEDEDDEETTDDEEEEEEEDERVNEDGKDESQEDEEGYFLQPLGVRHRRTLLRASGVQVDRTERNECQNIRTSRQTCGCNCAGVCKPDTCACAKLKIKCQVDRPSFPCGCTKESCGNPFGRVEFNPVRVRTHYLHTMMRMRMESQGRTVPGTPTYIRFDADQNSYCDHTPQSSTSVCSNDIQYCSTNDAGYSQSSNQSSQIPGFHTLFYPFRYNWNSSESAVGESKQNDNYWRLDASNNCSPRYSAYPTQPNSVVDQNVWSEHESTSQTSAVLENSLDSGYSESSSPIESHEINGLTTPCYPLSSLYVHHKQSPSITVSQNGPQTVQATVDCTLDVSPNESSQWSITGHDSALVGQS